MADLQEMTTALENSALKVGLNINNEKTKTMQVFAQDLTTKKLQTSHASHTLVVFSPRMETLMQTSTA